MPIIMLNVYSPCEGKQPFSDIIFSLPIVREYKLIIGGDLNFSINRREVWGNFTIIDKLTDYFSHKIEQVGLIRVWFVMMRFP